MQYNDIINSLDLKVLINKKYFKNDKMYFECSVPIESKRCIYCNYEKTYSHDYRISEIKDIPIRDKEVIIRLKRHRRKCPCCNKIFEIKPDFVSKYHKITNRLALRFFKEISKIKSIKLIAQENYVSSTTIQRYISKITILRRELPEVMCIDEFKGNSGKIKYQTSIADGKNKKMIDVVKSRYLKDLEEYFSKIDKEERERVKIFVSDMSKTFKEVKKEFFKKSIHVIDRYHFIRQVLWAMERVRQSEQNKMEKHERLKYKRSKSLLKKERKKLKEEEKIRLAQMLEGNERIRKAYKLKESFYDFVLKAKDRKQAKDRIENWCEQVEYVGEKEFKKVVKTLKNWLEEITNSFDYEYSNGYLEGKHNKIKTLKRVSFRIDNFESFRNRILLT